MRSARAICPALALAGAAGCVTMLPSGAHANGESLRIDVRDDSYTAWVAEPVAQLTTTDGTGARTSTTTLTQNRLLRVDDTHWRGMQGNAAISDEDLFRIAGDTAAADADRAYRRNGRLMQWAGILLAASGLAENLVARQQGWTGSTAEAVSGVAYGGLVGGVVLIVFGSKRLAADRHPVARERAEDAVQRYNQTLASPVTPALSLAPTVLEVGGRW